MAVTAAKSEHSLVRQTVQLAGPSTSSRRSSSRRCTLATDQHVIAVDVHGERPASVSASESLAGAELARSRGQSLADTLAGMAGVTTLRGTAGGMGKPIIRGHIRDDAT
jgi:iron complex outermembrane receptor protein